MPPLGRIRPPWAVWPPKTDDDGVRDKSVLAARRPRTEELLLPTEKAVAVDAIKASDAWETFIFVGCFVCCYIFIFCSVQEIMIAGRSDALQIIMRNGILFEADRSFFCSAPHEKDEVADTKISLGETRHVILLAKSVAFWGLAYVRFGMFRPRDENSVIPEPTFLAHTLLSNA